MISVKDITVRFEEKTYWTISPWKPEKGITALSGPLRLRQDHPAAGLAGLEHPPVDRGTVNHSRRSRRSSFSGGIGFSLAIYGAAHHRHTAPQPPG